MPHVQLKDFKMHYVESGIGAEPIVFVHGFISTNRWWQPTLDRLPGDTFHCYSVDLRASGESEQIETGHTLAQYADDLDQFVDAIELQKFILVGHSMGGGVAMQYALNHQDRLKALILVNPLASSGTKIDQSITDWINAQQGHPEGIRAILIGAFATPPGGEYFELLVTDATRWGPAIYLGTMDDMARFNVTDRQSTVNVPTLVTWGDKDAVIPFSPIVETYTSIPGCSLEVWHGVGHSGPIEIPDRFVELLTRFISEAMQAQA